MQVPQPWLAELKVSTEMHTVDVDFRNRFSWVPRLVLVPGGFNLGKRPWHNKRFFHNGFSGIPTPPNLNRTALKDPETTSADCLTVLGCKLRTIWRGVDASSERKLSWNEG